MKIICDSCGTKYSISDDKVRGKVFKIRCKKCSHIIVVRGGEEAAEAAAPAVEGGWHIVVDGEQVGPIGEADVRARIERGELKADTYTWREGFADWLKLSAVPEFADLVGGGESAAPAVDPFAAAAAPAANGAERARRPSGARGSLFGGAAAASSSDVFAAPAPTRGGGDLFAAASAAAAPAAESRWPSSGAAASGHDGGRVESLTGQRHENSVLFSLANLQSLAVSSPSKASAAPAGMGSPAPEGSGLIDIRAMAASTLGGSSEARGFGGGGGDDLPAFGSFSPAAPVLLPMQSAGAPKWIYPVVLLMVALVAVTVFFAFKLLTAKSPLEPVQVIVQAPAPAAPAETAKPAPTAKMGADGKPSTIPDEKLPPREGAEAKGEGKSEGKSEKSERSEHHRSKGGSGSGAGKEKKVAVADEKKGADADEKKPAKGSIDEMLLGAVSKKSGSSKSADDDPSRKAAESSAGPLAKNAVVAGMNAVKPKINDCYNQFKVPGMAMVNVVILKSGKVGSATVTGKFAGTPTGSCVEKAVKGAAFPPSDGLTTPYPFNLK
jgi:predicted Zn finger-like uncharacterized protein